MTKAENIEDKPHKMEAVKAIPRRMARFLWMSVGWLENLYQAGKAVEGVPLLHASLEDVQNGGRQSRIDAGVSRRMNHMLDACQAHRKPIHVAGMLASIESRRVKRYESRE